MSTKEEISIRWRFRQLREHKRNPGKLGYTPRGQYQNVHAKVAHKVGTGRKAIIEHAKYLENVDKKSIITGKTDLIGKIGDNIEFARKIGNEQEHYRIVLAPKRGDLLHMERFVKNVVKDVENEIKQKINYTAAIHKPSKPNSAGIYNVHAHLLVQGGFNRGANWFKRLFREAGSREATRQVEQQMGVDFNPMTKDKSIHKDYGKSHD